MYFISYKVNSVENTRVESENEIRDEEVYMHSEVR